MEGLPVLRLLSRGRWPAYRGTSISVDWAFA